MVTKKKSRFWSKEDTEHILNRIDSVPKDAPALRDTTIKSLAVQYGVTMNAIKCKYAKTKAKRALSKAKSNTIKEPVVSKPRGKYKLRVQPIVVEKPQRQLTFDIKNVDIDLANGKLVITY